MARKEKPVITLAKHVEWAEKEGINIFCLVVPKSVPVWLSDFIEGHLKIGDLLSFPEMNKSIHQQVKIMTNIFNNPKNKVKYVVTQSPWIISDFDRRAVLLPTDSTVETQHRQTFGASVNMITMTILGRHITCGNLAIKQMKAIQKKAEETTDLDKLNELADKLSLTFGDSIEKSLILKPIYDKIDALESKNEKEEFTE
jgi:hypothetical protein